MCKNKETEIGKKEQIKNILRVGSSNTENYNNNDFYFFKNLLTKKWPGIYILHQFS